MTPGPGIEREMRRAPSGLRHPGSHEAAILMRNILSVNLHYVNRERLESKLPKGP